MKRRIVHGVRVFTQDAPIFLWKLSPIFYELTRCRKPLIRSSVYQESLDRGIEAIRKNELRDVVADESKFRGFLANSELRTAMGWRDAEFVSVEEWEPIQKGFLIPTDLDILIDKVYVAPTSEEWFRNLVEAVLRKYGHPHAVEKSDLMTDPVW